MSRPNNTIYTQTAAIQIEGVGLIRSAARAARDSSAAFAAMMNDEMNDGVNPPTIAPADIDALRALHPRANAALLAEEFSNASNYLKSGAGYKALEQIAAGDPVDEVIAEMTAWHKK